MIESTRPEPPREAALIEAARKRERLTIRKAAGQAGMSDARWRQITSGYVSLGGGTYKRITAPDDTLARMAQTVRVTPDQLRAVGRKDAAQALEEITPNPGETGPYTPPVDAVYAILTSLPLEAQAEVVRRLARENPAAVQPSEGPARRAG